jgi:hypothetical protein
MSDDALRAAFARGFRRGWMGDDLGPVTIDMPPIFDDLRRVSMTQAQRIAVANALRDVADRIEND